MNRWNKKFETHDIHSTLERIFNDLNMDVQTTYGHLNIEERRLFKLISVLRSTLKNLDSELVPYSLLSTLNQNFNFNNSNNKSVVNAYNNYKSNRNPENLETVNDHLDNVLLALSQLSAMAKISRTTTRSKKFQDALDEFSENMFLKNKELEEKIAQADKLLESQDQRLQELSSSIAEKKKETDGAFVDWQKQYSNDQGNRQTDFLTAEQDRTAAFAEWKRQIDEDTKNNINNLIANSTADLKKHESDFTKKISSILDDSKNKHKDILDLHELVAGDSVASGYLQSAESDKKEANFWRRSTIAFIISTAIWTGYAYISNAGDYGAPSEIFWKALPSFPITGVLLFGAAYSARQSRSHRQSEVQARWFALEVKAIDPFIASLPEEDQKALKNKLSERLFAQGHRMMEPDTSTINKKDFFATIKGVTEVLKAK